MRLYEDVTRILKMIQMLEATDNKTSEKLMELKEK
jgi:SUMO ligase MMS21 Smc5/6 complex component